MKREIDIPRERLVVFYRIIVVFMLLLVVLLIAGSLYAFVRPKASGPLFRIGGAREPSDTRGNLAGNRGTSSVFTGIGTLRIQNTGKPATGQKPAVIILSISFPYPADDRLFTEELASCIREFRSIATKYFANLPSDKLARLDEEQAKAEILRQYNALLRLGRIETLYFSDLMIMD